MRCVNGERKLQLITKVVHVFIVGIIEVWGLFTFIIKMTIKSSASTEVIL